MGKLKEIKLQRQAEIDEKGFSELSKFEKLEKYNIKQNLAQLSNKFKRKKKQAANLKIPLKVEEEVKFENEPQPDKLASSANIESNFDVSPVRPQGINEKVKIPKFSSNSDIEKSMGIRKTEFNYPIKVIQTQPSQIFNSEPGPVDFKGKFRENDMYIPLSRESSFSKYPEQSPLDFGVSPLMNPWER